MANKVLRVAIYSHNAKRHYIKRRFWNKLTGLVYIFSPMSVRRGIDRNNGLGEYLHHVYTFKAIGAMQEKKIRDDKKYSKHAENLNYELKVDLERLAKTQFGGNWSADLTTMIITSSTGSIKKITGTSRRDVKFL